MRIATVADIPIRLHWSFLGLVAIYSALTAWGSGLGGLIEGLALGVALFGSVVLHELGHALAARAFGIRTAHITLYPFGGIAAITRMPANAVQELLIALAGPAVNLVLVALFAPLALLFGSWALAVVAGLNAVMGLFNLIPAFPMDGGRVLRALLTRPLGFVRASFLSMRIGTGFAALFLVGGAVSGNWSLVLVGGFLLVAIAGERRRLRELLARGWRGPFVRPVWAGLGR
jgi:Zn-dependent protease